MDNSERLGTEDKPAVLEEPKPAKSAAPAAWQKVPGISGVNKWLSKIEDWLNIAGVALIASIMALAVIDVGGRFLFNKPIRGAVEISELSMAGVVFLGIAYTMRTGGHIRVDMLINRIHGRSFHIIESFTILLSLFLFSVAFVSSWKFTVKSFSFGDTTPQLLIATWPAKMLVTLGAFLLCLRLLIILIQHISQAVAGVERRSL